MKAQLNQTPSDLNNPNDLGKRFEVLSDRLDKIPTACPKALRDKINANIAAFQDWYYGNPKGKYVGSDWVVDSWSTDEMGTYNNLYRETVLALEEAEKITAGMPAPAPDQPTGPIVTLEPEKIVARTPLWWLLIPGGVLFSGALWFAFFRKPGPKSVNPAPALAGGFGLYPAAHIERANRYAKDSKYATDAVPKIAKQKRCNGALSYLLEAYSDIDIAANHMVSVIDDPRAKKTDKEKAQKFIDKDIANLYKALNDSVMVFENACFEAGSRRKE
jgi:hypothetical protein